MSDLVREAVRAYYRLHQTVSAVAMDPNSADAHERLSAAAYEANAAMGAAGLLGKSEVELMALVREQFPEI
ncbi:hypothetical protein ACGFY6_33410 [Streptomyces sp. NPDC048387]|uniref:hypothetical protein n=1 Tax=Streptomyces sp. NPDC048387 TaxID=3365542 RepID=UPI003716C8DA